MSLAELDPLKALDCSDIQPDKLGTGSFPSGHFIRKQLRLEPLDCARPGHSPISSKRFAL
jgi:hypothetical protein